MVNGPLKNEKSRQILSKSRNLAQPLMSLGVSEFVSVGHIFAFLLSHYTFSSRAWILKRQSRSLGESRIYQSPPLTLYHCCVKDWRKKGADKKYAKKTEVYMYAVHNTHLSYTLELTIVQVSRLIENRPKASLEDATYCEAPENTKVSNLTNHRSCSGVRVVI